MCSQTGRRARTESAINTFLGMESSMRLIQTWGFSDCSQGILDMRHSDCPASAVTCSSCRVRNHNHMHSEIVREVALPPRIMRCAVQLQVPAQSEWTHSTVTSCHWQFNCSSFSSCQFQHSCLFFCNLGTSLSEVSDSGILTGIVVVSVQEGEAFFAIVAVIQLSSAYFFLCYSIRFE